METDLRRHFQNQKYSGRYEPIPIHFIIFQVKVFSTFYSQVYVIYKMVTSTKWFLFLVFQSAFYFLVDL